MTGAKPQMPNKPRQLKETTRHREAFLAWYENDRHFRLTLGKVAVSEPTLMSWIKKFNWHERGDELDRKAFAKLEQKVVEAKAKRTIEMVENHFKYGQMLVNVGGNYISDRNNKIRHHTEAAQLMKLGIDTQRTAEGMAISKNDLEANVKHEIITFQIKTTNDGSE